MVDHPEQMVYAGRLKKLSGHKPLVFMKIDGGYHRAGVNPNSNMASALTEAIVQSELDGNITFLGLYIHAGHSYETRKDWQALEYVLEEFTILGHTAETLGLTSSRSSITLSVGASPTATSLQHPDLIQASSEDNICRSLRRELDALKGKGFDLEVHAGVYPTLDLQQLATHARDHRLLSCSDIAISILADIVSLYPGRGENGTTEALINVGCLGLGREPCQDMGSQKGIHYNGWGIAMPWPESFHNPAPGLGFPAIHGGWQVGKISQEHGILKWRGDPSEEIPLKVGQRIRIWPNHSCIAGAGFDYYLIVDSRNEGAEDVVIDVWPRWSGW
jgi:D-serine deaminase-like pyridoxal phosphate-dependent protein